MDIKQERLKSEPEQLDNEKEKVEHQAGEAHQRAGAAKHEREGANSAVMAVERVGEVGQQA